MDTQPLLAGPTIRLRPLRADEFEALFEVASDPLIWEQHPQKERYRRDVFTKFFESALASKGALVAEDSDGRILGSSRYYDFKPSERAITIGYTFLARAHWGGSTNREMKTLMLDHAFKSVERVYFEIGADNRRSRRAIEKIGATIARSGVLDGKAYAIYKIDRVDWRILSS